MSRQSDRKTTKQVRIDSRMHRYLKIEAAKRGESIRDLVEGVLGETILAADHKNDEDE